MHAEVWIHFTLFNNITYSKTVTFIGHWRKVDQFTTVLSYWTCNLTERKTSGMKESSHLHTNRWCLILWISWKLVMWNRGLKLNWAKSNFDWILYTPIIFWNIVREIRKYVFIDKELLIYFLLEYWWDLLISIFQTRHARSVVHLQLIGWPPAYVILLYTYLQ